MKTILTLTDFSGNSNNGLAFAAELAKRGSARLILMHTLQNRGEENEALQKLKTAEAELKSKFGAELNCTIHVAQGNLADTVDDIKKRQQIDLLVMGTKGASGLKRV